MEDTGTQEELKKIFIAHVKASVKKNDFDFDPVRERCKLLAREYFSAMIDGHLLGIDAVDITFDVITLPSKDSAEKVDSVSLEYGNLYSFVLAHGEFVPYYEWVGDDQFYKGKLGLYHKTVVHSDTKHYVFIPNDDYKNANESNFKLAV